MNDETIASVLNNIELPNEGLVGYSTDFGLSGTLSVNRPSIPIPDYHVPLKQSDNYAFDPTAALGAPDPNLRTPYVQAWTLSLQHEIKGTIFEARYVANHSTKSFRAFDYNQVVIKENGFLDEFKKAQSNGNLALARNGTFNPAFNAAIPGSQPLNLLGQFSSRGSLNNSEVRSLIQEGQAGELAYFYQVNGYSAPIALFRNPVALGADTISNFSNSSLQLAATRRAPPAQLRPRFSGQLYFLESFERRERR